MKIVIALTLLVLLGYAGLTVYHNVVKQKEQVKIEQVKTEKPAPVKAQEAKKPVEVAKPKPKEPIKHDNSAKIKALKADFYKLDKQADKLTEQYNDLTAERKTAIAQKPQSVFLIDRQITALDNQINIIKQGIDKLNLQLRDLNFGLKNNRQIMYLGKKMNVTEVKRIKLNAEIKKLQEKYNPLVVRLSQLQTQRGAEIDSADQRRDLQVKAIDERLKTIVDRINAIRSEQKRIVAEYRALE